MSRIRRACAGKSASTGGLNLPEIKSLAIKENIDIKGLNRAEILELLCSSLGIKPLDKPEKKLTVIKPVKIKPLDRESIKKPTIIKPEPLDIESAKKPTVVKPVKIKPVNRESIKKATPETSAIVLANRASTTFKVITYNVWFDEYNLLNRIIKIANIISNEAPDVACLQEVKPKILQELLTRLSDQYTFSKEYLTQGYDTVILVKLSHEILDVNRYNFEGSRMGRGLETVTIAADTDIVYVVGTFHIESVFGDKDVTEVKRLQLKASLIESRGMAEKTGAKHMIIMGDTNLGFREFYRTNAYWKDAWEAAGKPKDHTYTTDGKRNDNIKHNFRNRMDRIYVGKGTDIVAFRLLGTEQPCPSDHFGVMVTIKQ